MQEIEQPSISCSIANNPMKIRQILAISGLAACLALAGCSKTEPEAAATTTPGAPPAAAGEPGGAQKVQSIPEGGVPAGGVVFTPKNPDDPHFKPDPKLKGGG